MFELITPLSYWLLTALWLVILVLYIAKLRHSQSAEKTVTVLLVILAIDAFRTVFESAYFGLYFNSLYGLLPKVFHEVLSQPGLLVIPKILNIIAALLVLFLLIRHWVPRQIREREEWIESLKDAKAHAEVRQDDAEQQYLKFKSIFDGIPDAIVFSDTDRKIISTNIGTEKTFEYTASELIGKSTAVLYERNEEFERQGRDRYNLSAKAKAEPYEVNYRRKSGQIFVGETVGTTVHDPKGSIVGYVVVIRNVNDRKQAEEKLKQAEVVLESSENRLRLALAVTKQSWFDLNVQTGEALTSPEYSKTLGYSPARFHSDLQGWEDSLHPDDHDAVMAAYQKCLSQGTPFSTEYRRRTKSGNWLWFNTTGEIFEWNSLQQPLRLIGIHTNITERKQAEGKLERIAHYDVLTDLPNRVLLADRLSQAMVLSQRRKQSLAVAYLDLDGFKAVNDTYGHDTGDKLLVDLSQRMQKVLREGDTLARIGGDEFIAVMVDLEKIEDSQPILERLLIAAAAPISVGDLQLQVSASIGVTLYPQDGADADQLIRHADQAMYVAKQAGKNRYHLFDTALENKIKIQREGIGDIRLALERGEFVLHYQPKVNMRTGEVKGVEALIRWQHPDRGLVPPLEFLPVIEGQAISLELGEWVIGTALSQISQWGSMGVNLPISVNISAYQLQQDDFATRLAALLAAHPDVSPRSLELEILETSALHDISQVTATMNACHELGVRFALDDFGTGYSSLSHLRRLPAYLIKIDQTFVRDMLEDTDDLAIVEGVVGLAKAFQREVIAEGVETIAHGEALLQLGCELAQGYGIARPMPADDLPEWVSSWKADESWQAQSIVDAT